MAGVRLGDGEVIDADVVVVGVGVQPNTEWLDSSGLTIENGVLCDETCLAAPDVVAAGDVARWRNVRFDEVMRVEHWENARRQGATAAKAMLGQGVVDTRPSYFFSDQYDLGMEYSGLAMPGEYDDVVYRGDKDKREFVAFWLKDRRVIAGMNVNVWDVTQPIQQMIRSKEPVDASRLADPDVPLEELAPAPA